jgi:hypothetical protein
MKQIELTSKLVLAIIGLTSVSAILVPTYAAPAITSADIVDGTIQSVDIKNGEVKNSDLANGAVTSGKIADGTIQEQDIADGVIPDGGDAIQLNVHRVESEEFKVPTGYASWDVDCPSGEIVTGGGYDTVVTNVVSSFPLDENTWRVNANPDFGDPNVTAPLKVYALCVDPTIP